MAWFRRTVHVLQHYRGYLHFQHDAKWCAGITLGEIMYIVRGRNDESKYLYFNKAWVFNLLPCYLHLCPKQTIMLKACLRTFQHMFYESFCITGKQYNVEGQSIEITEPETRTTWCWKHFSLLRQLCVLYYIFQHDTGVLSSPFLAAKPAYMFVGRHAAHRPGDRTTLVCHCNGITEYDKNPKGSFSFLHSASEQKLQSVNQCWCSKGLFINFIYTHSVITLEHLITPM